MRTADEGILRAGKGHQFVFSGPADRSEYDTIGTGSLRDADLRDAVAPRARGAVASAPDMQRAVANGVEAIDKHCAKPALGASSAPGHAGERPGTVVQPMVSRLGSEPTAVPASIAAACPATALSPGTCPAGVAPMPESAEQQARRLFHRAVVLVIGGSAPMVTAPQLAAAMDVDVESARALVRQREAQRVLRSCGGKLGREVLRDDVTARALSRARAVVGTDARAVHQPAPTPAAGLTPAISGASGACGPVPTRRHGVDTPARHGCSGAGAAVRVESLNPSSAGPGVLKRKASVALAESSPLEA